MPVSFTLLEGGGGREGGGGGGGENFKNMFEALFPHLKGVDMPNFSRF